MGGNIRVESDLGKGSTFTLSLPVKEANIYETELVTDHSVAQVLHATKSVSLNTEVVSQNQQKGNLLIVEDNLEVQSFLKDLLSTNYHTITKNNGLEALNFLKEQNKENVDLILSDINMPLMDGYELLKVLKQDEQLQQLPVIMLTAKVKEKSKLKALRMGVDDYLTKPFSPTELTLRIQNLLNNYQQRVVYQKAYYEVAPQFEDAISADQSWLQELENKALEALEKQLDLTIPYLSNTMAISQRQLARRIKLLTGLTVGKYIQEIKLQKARYLLENRIIQSVAEAAYLSGFKSPSHFNKIYFRYYGKNPSTYL